MNLKDLAQMAVDSAMKAGAEWADATVSQVLHVGVELEKSSIRECEVVREYGIGVRAFNRGGVGTATADRHDEESVRECGVQAAALARATHGDPDFVELPGPKPFEDVPGLFCDKVAGLHAAEAVRWCQMAINEANEVSPEVTLAGGAGFSVGDHATVTSTGVVFGRAGTLVDMSMQGVVRTDDDAGSYFEFDVARRLEDFVPEGIGRMAATEALRYLGSQHVNTERLTLVLGPMAAQDLIGSAIGAANAESIQRQRSYLIGKERERIAAECITVWEEPFVPAGLMSAGCDGEGQPKVRRALIDQGVLTTFLHNSYTANKAKVPTTAHGARGGAGVGIGTSNLQVARGDKTEAELIAEVDNGIYINSAGIQPDAVSGDVSATIDFGFKIENGKLAYPVQTTMIGSDIFEMLANIDAVSSDYREEPGSIFPSLRITGIQVVGGK